MSIHLYKLKGSLHESWISTHIYVILCTAFSLAQICRLSVAGSAAAFQLSYQLLLNTSVCLIIACFSAAAANVLAAQ